MCCAHAHARAAPRYLVGARSEGEPGVGESAERGLRHISIVGQQANADGAGARSPSFRISCWQRDLRGDGECSPGGEWHIEFAPSGGEQRWSTGTAVSGGRSRCRCRRRFRRRAENAAEMVIQGGRRELPGTSAHGAHPTRRRIARRGRPWPAANWRVALEVVSGFRAVGTPARGETAQALFGVDEVCRVCHPTGAVFRRIGQRASLLSVGRRTRKPATGSRGSGSRSFGHDGQAALPGRLELAAYRRRALRTGLLDHVRLTALSE
mmetsp:Transcript_50805/g.148055  ORF Transcript_50805/g.148055 Transcript_50805/m.148055 type:complete len:266 (-) Transcript_50805:1084-1881(-)